MEKFNEKEMRQLAAVVTLGSINWYTVSRKMTEMIDRIVILESELTELNKKPPANAGG